MPRKGRKRKKQKRATKPGKRGYLYIREDMFTPEGVLITTPLAIGIKGNQESECAKSREEEISARETKGE